MAGNHANPPAPFNPLYDANAQDRYARVTKSMEDDNYYEGHSREECKAEWARRYDADKERTGTSQPHSLMEFKVPGGKLVFDLQGTILEVTETCNPEWDRTWYYDIENWLVSSHGKKGDTPDRPMTAEAIEWVQKHYLPKVDLTGTGPKL